MIADQNPGSVQSSIWTSFLGRNTAFVNGPESLALRYALPVVYAYTAPRSDGGYTIECKEIYNGQEVVQPGVITGRFAGSLEENIRDFRAHWLWSHKRWKRKAQAVPQPSWFLLWNELSVIGDGSWQVTLSFPTFTLDANQSPEIWQNKSRATWRNIYEARISDIPWWPYWFSSAFFCWSPFYGWDCIRIMARNWLCRTIPGFSTKML